MSRNVSYGLVALILLWTQCMFSSDDNVIANNGKVFLYSDIEREGTLCPPAYERYWATSSTSWGSVITGGVSNKENAIDGRPDTHSIITVAIGLAGVGTTWQNIYFEEDQAAGTPVTIKLGKEISGAALLGGLTVVGLDKDGKTIGVIEGVDGGLLDVLAGDNVLEYTFIPTSNKGHLAYRGVRVTLGATLSVAQNARVYGAYVKKLVDQSNCLPVLDNINPNVLDVLHGVEDIGLGLVSSTATVTEPWKAVDNDPDSYALISRGVAVANMASLTAVFKQEAMKGDELFITAENRNPGILSLELVKGFKIQRYLGSTKVGDVLTESNGALRLRLLGLGARDRYRIVVAPSEEPFDRVKISYGSVVGVLGDFTRVYNIDLAPTVDVGLEVETDEYGYELEQILQLCEGEPLRIKPQTDDCTAYEVYTSEDAMIRLPTLEDQYTIDLSNHYQAGDVFTVYVQAFRHGCSIGPLIPIKIKINTIPIIKEIAALDHKGNKRVINSDILVVGGQRLELLPAVDKEIQHYAWDFRESGKELWEGLPFATIDNPEVEVRKTILERNEKGEVVFDENDMPIVKQEGGVYITKPGTGSLVVSFPANAMLDNGDSWHRKKGQLRVSITDLTGCTTSVIYDIAFQRAYRQGVFSNQMLPAKK